MGLAVVLQDRKPTTLRAAPTSEVVTESFLLVRLPRMSFVYQHTFEPLPEIPCTFGESVIRFKLSYTQLPVEYAESEIRFPAAS